MNQIFDLWFESRIISFTMKKQSGENALDELDGLSVGAV